MRAYELIKRKRDGGALTPAEIEAFLRAYTAGELPDYQAAALLMAIFYRGLLPDELAAWTRAMLESGEVLDLSAVPGRKVDKHSTGGVGDKISLPLAPLVAACGVLVPMIAGRGLGHTGGTVDKLEAIAGFGVALSVERFQRQVAELGCCLLGQTDSIAPADRKLYALRDATATIDSIPLIASSIMSKKLAEGIDGLVLDVKVGSGAFMKNLDDARALAKTLVEIGRGMGKEVVALLTDMSQPLGRTVGNALEVRESIEVLTGGGPEDVVALTVELGAEMLVLSRLAATLDEGRETIRGAIADRSGLAKFRAIVEAQGGDVRMIDDPDRLPRAPIVLDACADRAGVITAVATEEIGLAAMSLGAGRARKEDVIDPAVGFVIEKRIGDRVAVGERLAQVHCASRAQGEAAAARLITAYQLGGAAPAPVALLQDRIA